MIDKKEKVGMSIAQDAVDAYRRQSQEFDEGWVAPMYFASGYTRARLTPMPISDFLLTLKMKIGYLILVLIGALLGVGLVTTYAWSIASFTTFSRFFMTVVSAVAALAFAIARTYKLWAESKKLLAETRKVELENSKYPAKDGC